MSSQKEFLTALHNNAKESLDRFNSNNAAYSDEELNWKPDSSSWSIGEALEHIIQTNSLYYDMFDNIIKSAPATDNQVLPVKHTFFGKLLIKTMTSPKKYKTSKVFEPKASRIGSDVYSRFKEQHIKLMGFIDKAQKVDLTKNKITSPAGKLIKYNFGDALAILVHHTKRHLDQVDRVEKMYREK